MKDYLKCSLTEDEKKLIKGIIWRTAKTYKQRGYKKSLEETLYIDDIEMGLEDEYQYVCSDTIVFTSPLRPYTQDEKQKIIDFMDSMLKELSLNRFRIALTFEEKLVFFLYYFQKYTEDDIVILLGISKRTLTNRKKSIKSKRVEILGGNKNV